MLSSRSQLIRQMRRPKTLGTVNRRFSTLPPFPASMSSQERFVASASELLLYTLLFVQPLVGWGMLSAARYPIVLFGSAQEPLHEPHRNICPPGNPLPPPTA